MSINLSKKQRRYVIDCDCCEEELYINQEDEKAENFDMTEVQQLIYDNETYSDAFDNCSQSIAQLLNETIEESEYFEHNDEDYKLTYTDIREELHNRF